MGSALLVTTGTLAGALVGWILGSRSTARTTAVHLERLRGLVEAEVEHAARRRRVAEAEVRRV